LLSAVMSIIIGFDPSGTGRDRIDHCPQPATCK
jgi:hypothetical protein